MKFFPESALVQLEYEKVKSILGEHCKTEYAKSRAVALRIHTRKDFIELELKQSYEYKLLIQGGLRESRQNYKSAIAFSTTFR